MELTPRLAQLFSHAYVLGGSPCSGKSTIAARLSQQFGLDHYKVDDYEQAHLARCRPEEQPVMSRYAHMSWDEIWMQPLATHVEDVFAFYRERFQFILDDLDALDPMGPVILEGVAFLPELVQRAGVRRDRVLYMVPTLAFQMEHYRQRPWTQEILRQCRNPVQAFDNWMMRDHRFGREILRQAEHYGYRTLIMDGSLGIDAAYAHIFTLIAPSSAGATGASIPGVGCTCD